MRIKKITKINCKNEKFYDLNVALNNNYVLGNGCLVHNTGYNFSSLRPRGAIVKSTGKSSSGVIPFLKAYDAACGAVNQGGCFIGSTLVLTVNGAKPIKDINKKTYIYSYNNGKQIVTQCSKSWKTKDNAEVWKIKTTNLEFFATPDHRFMIKDGTYVELKDLKPNDKLMDVGIKSEFVVSIEFSHHEDVYDIEVPLTRNFAIGNKDIISGVFVHNSRRGANMSILSVHHPDLMEFLSCKTDNNDINNFNLSVGVTDEFFDAVEKDKDWELFFADEDGKRIPFYPNGDEEQTPVTEYIVKAKEIYDIIIKQAHKNGEPGIIFLDRLQESNSVPKYKIVATNPCLTGDTLIGVADDRHYIPLEQLYKEFESDPENFNVETFGYDKETKQTIPCKIQFVVNQGIKKVFKLTLNDNEFVKATENHKFILANGERCELKDLKTGDELIPFYADNLGKLKMETLNVDAIKQNEDDFYFVKSIEYVGEETVYDLHVPNTNSMAIITNYEILDVYGFASGIIVSNCGKNVCLN